MLNSPDYMSNVHRVYIGDMMSRLEVEYKTIGTQKRKGIKLRPGEYEKIIQERYEEIKQLISNGFSKPRICKILRDKYGVITEPSYMRRTLKQIEGCHA